MTSAVAHQNGTVVDVFSPSNQTKALDITRTRLPSFSYQMINREFEKLDEPQSAHVWIGESVALFGRLS